LIKKKKKIGLLKFFLGLIKFFFFKLGLINFFFFGLILLGALGKGLTGLAFGPALSMSYPLDIICWIGLDIYLKFCAEVEMRLGCLSLS
jgi:hypothetical protein